MVILFFILDHDMKKLLIIPAAIMLLASCSPKASDQVSDAVKNEIMTLDGGYEKVVIKSIEKVDSTTFAQEFERRIGTFETKKKADEQLLLKYTRENKKRNAAIKQESLARDLMILTGLDSLKASMSAKLGQVAYYEYKFSAQASKPGKTVAFNESFAAVSPSGEVLCIASKQNDLHRRLGTVIPGYLEVVKGDENASVDPIEE